mmetsp:Transcript_12782/g.14423  ORF Transcript_12782/g.14423 Transcript_12782/m.14423 type:complete len:288 (-) Transcript_12782:128-991(-)
MKVMPSNQQFPYHISDAEVSQMIEAVCSNTDFNDDDTKHINRRWVKAVMSQPYSEDKTIRRPFEYSQKKIEKHIKWRKENRVNSLMSTYLSQQPSDEDNELQFEIDQGAFYWYGVDNERSPNVWLALDDKGNWRSNFDEERKLKCAYLYLQAAFDVMPPDVHNVNVILLLDKFPLSEVIKHPTFAVKFLKNFMVSSPDRLKRAVLVTGNLVNVFYKVAKRLAPKNVLSKIKVFRSREEAASYLASKKIVKNVNEVPFAREGKMHEDEITKSFSSMIGAIEKQMSQSP